MQHAESRAGGMTEGGDRAGGVPEGEGESEASDSAGGKAPHR